MTGRGTPPPYIRTQGQDVSLSPLSPSSENPCKIRLSWVTTVVVIRCHFDVTRVVTHEKSGGFLLHVCVMPGCPLGWGWPRRRAGLGLGVAPQSAFPDPEDRLKHPARLPCGGCWSSCAACLSPRPPAAWSAPPKSHQRPGLPRWRCAPRRAPGGCARRRSS